LEAAQGFHMEKTSDTQAALEPLQGYPELPIEEMRARAEAFRATLSSRRTVRDYQDRPVPRDVLETCLRVATGAPSGANLQPWHFCVVTDPDTKRRVRLAAEEDEREFLRDRAPDEWLKAQAPRGTDADKGLQDRATLIAIFAQRFGTLPDGTRVKHYYVPESVGIATGFLIAALHSAGLATLTHTPSPMGFLSEICGRPENEKPYLLLVAGYPAPDAMVPVFGGTRRPLEDSISWI
jgi:iodotyrosine deiodinase